MPKPAQPASFPLLPAPESLPAEQRAIWDELAPLACKARTLIPETAAAFRLLCKAIAMEGKYAAKIEQDGMTYIAVTIDGSGQEREALKAHPLCGAHRGMMQRVEAGLQRFRLAPMGKEIVPPDKPVDPFDEFDQETVQ